jgi:hypothetical protein
MDSSNLKQRLAAFEARIKFYEDWRDVLVAERQKRLDLYNVLAEEARTQVRHSTHEDRMPDIQTEIRAIDTGDTRRFSITVELHALLTQPDNPASITRTICSRRSGTSASKWRRRRHSSRTCYDRIVSDPAANIFFRGTTARFGAFSPARSST